MNLVNPAKLAQIANVSERAVRKACGTGGPLADARRARGRIDLDHPSTRAWLEEHGADPDTSIPPPVTRTAKELAAQLGATAADPLERIADMSLREISARYGSDLAFHGWVRARKELAMARVHEERLAKLSGQLIGRDRVQLLFDALDLLVLRLARDAAITIARDVRNPHITRERAIAAAQEAMLGAARDTRDTMRAIVAGIDPRAELRDPRERPSRDPARSGALKALEALREPLRAIAPDIVRAVAKDIGRAASGREWRADVFTDALELAAGVEQEAVRGVQCRLDAAITAAITRTNRPAMEIPPEPMSITGGARRRKAKPKRRARRASRAKETT